MRSLIIHLSRAAARAENVSRLLRVLPDAEIVEAIDGNDPAAAQEIKQVSGTLHSPRYPFSLNPAEVGCFLSHRQCWKIIAEGDAPYALIAEDDMAIEPEPFAAAMELVRQHANEDSYIRLPAKPRERVTGIVAKQDGAELFLPRTIGLQLVCQIVGRAAARRLLAASEVIDRPVDTTLQMHWVTGQKIHAILPSGVSEIHGPSTIQIKTRTSDVLMREMRRARYRAQIRRKPQLA
jgi:GR25 family glycosyltransferase involved in LPS biosynthesis